MERKHISEFTVKPEMKEIKDILEYMGKNSSRARTLLKGKAVFLALSCLVPSGFAETLARVDTPGETVSDPNRITFTEVGPGWTAEGTAVSFYGISRAIAETDATAATGFDDAWCYSIAQWTDSFTVNNDDRIGEMDRMDLEITLSGSLLGRAQVRYILDRDLIENVYDPSDDVANFQYPAIGPGPTVVDRTIIADVEFTYGETYQLRSYLEVFAQSLAGEGAAYSDFVRTAYLSKITVPEGAVLVTGSGTTYPVPYCEIFCDGFEG